MDIREYTWQRGETGDGDPPSVKAQFADLEEVITTLERDGDLYDAEHQHIFDLEIRGQQLRESGDSHDALADIMTQIQTELARLGLAEKTAQLAGKIRSAYQKGQNPDL